MQKIKSPIDRLNDRVFNAIYTRSLVYNTCWEDPAVDRQALDFQPDDNVLVIASAGCNTLDYALTGPARINAVDMNPRQIALLELKLAGIRGLEFDDYFQLFGRGRHAEIADIYHERLREQLSPFAQVYWDKNLNWFNARNGRVGGLYFHGLSGKVAHMFHMYLGVAPKLRTGIEAILATDTLDAQREVYDAQIRPYVFNRRMNWVLSRQLTMNMLGVPHPQRKEVELQHDGGVAAFIQDCIAYVFRQLPLHMNYFWRVYMVGEYSETCAPEYLKRANFEKLKGGLVDSIKPYTCSVTQFLRTTEQQINKYVLLDHMDWMSSYWPQALSEEWQAIFDSASENARLIFRSAHAWPKYLDHVTVPENGRNVSILDKMHFYPELAARLQPEDRVHTYAGFHIADLQAA